MSVVTFSATADLADVSVNPVNPVNPGTIAKEEGAMEHRSEWKDEGSQDDAENKENDSVGDMEARDAGRRKSRISGRMSASIGGIVRYINRSTIVGRRSVFGTRGGEQQDLVLAVRASLVDGDIIEGEIMRFWDQKRTVLASAFLLATFVASLLLVVTLVVATHKHEKEPHVHVHVHEEPTGPPTASSPMLISLDALDSRSTLQAVRARGHLRCGVVSFDGFYRLDRHTGHEWGFCHDLCRALSAVILGDPTKITPVPASFSDRFIKLRNGSMDVLLGSDTHTLEREVAETTTGSGFTFSVPYYYDGVIFAGNATFVECANQKKRFGECTQLSICTLMGTTAETFVSSRFPLSFMRSVYSVDDLFQSYFNRTCNIVATEKSQTSVPLIQEAIRNGEYHVGDVTYTKEPLAAVTRKSDRYWSDIVNWVIQALFYGEEHGLKRNSTLCHNETYDDESMQPLDFFRAVYCVGNYGELFRQNFAGMDRGWNAINQGTEMLYAVPFGNTEKEPFIGLNTDGSFGKIMTEGTLNCGVFVRSNFAEFSSETQTWVGMDVDYCRAVAAAIFHGNSNAVTITPLSDSEFSSLKVLKNEKVDVIAGAKVDFKLDLKKPSRKGFTFTTPYYYDINNQTKNVYALVTSEHDTLFSSFVNAVVLATFYADENSITYDINGDIFVEDIPLVSIFGADFRWALRDAIFYSGSYSDIYHRNLGNKNDEYRGRNRMNLLGKPQLLSLPGLGNRS